MKEVLFFRLSAYRKVYQDAHFFGMHGSKRVAIRNITKTLIELDRQG